MKNHTVFIGLGTNLGNRENNLHRALAALSAILHIEKRSSVYETEPIGYTAQDRFLNMALRGTVADAPHALLKKLQAIELRMGRQRGIAHGPRTIDLDILFFDDLVVADPDLTIPHPEIQNRGFVLVPLNEIAPAFVHPLLHRDMQSLLLMLKNSKQVTPWKNSTPAR